MKRKQILLVETFFKGSHKSWANQLKFYLEKESHFDLTILPIDSLSWKDSMLVGVDFLPEINNQFDLIIVSSMVNLKEFKERFNLKVPHIIYFHENQIAYPWTTNDRNGKKPIFGEIQIEGAKLADGLCFNSKYNFNTFTQNHFEFVKKSKILPIGLETEKYEKFKVTKNNELTFLWNHRWEYDKNPKYFFEILRKIKTKYSFKLIVTGESPFHVENIEFKKARKDFKEDIIHFGHVDSFKEYIQLLWRSHISFNTSIHDFFGISVCESALCDVTTILPKSLAYPEHFENSENFYETENELLKKIDLATKNELSSKHLVAKYNWNILIKDYISYFKLSSR